MKELLKEIGISIAVGLIFTLIYAQAAFDWIGNIVTYYGGAL